ncbi:Thioredoxin [Burkholderia multivorans]|uniref:Thioredoxin n=1 Tax=Burkholderia multivorans TaxID=87883 RepID=A0ABD7L6Y7_9BURK|nr:thioredoxin family protein [Burkholderia multivorans]SAJ97507.1 Thioredoxin [Burkholderia multivorans]
MTTIIEISDTTFSQDIQGSAPVLVDFWAPWCGPCLALAPHLEKLAADYTGHLKVLKLNIDEVPNGWERFGVRAIPALVFYVNGAEHSRLTGPSTMRLRVMLEKWFEECQLKGPGTPPVSTEQTVSQTELPTWLSFRGDPSVKAAAIARWRDIDLESYPRPTFCLAGEDETFESVVGAPEQLGDLLNNVWWLQSDNTENHQIHQQLLELMEAIPVGADLSDVASDTLYALIYHSPWEITQYVSEGATSNLMARIKALHNNERVGDVTPPNTWTALQREAVLLVDQGCDESTSEMLESLARPLNALSASEILGAMFVHARTDYRHYSAWSDDEYARVSEIQDVNAKQVKAELGDAPDDTDGRRVWMERVNERHQALDCKCRDADPILWGRYDEWLVNVGDVQRKIRNELVGPIRDFVGEAYHEV